MYQFINWAFWIIGIINLFGSNMTKQSEAILENNLIQQLVGLGYESVKVMDGDALVSNLKK